MIPAIGDVQLLRAVEWNLADTCFEMVDALPGATLLDHRHETPHVMFMLAGELKEEGRTYQCGDVRLSPAFDRHFLRFTCRSKCLLLHLDSRHELGQIEERWSASLGSAFSKATTLARRVGARDEASNLLASLLVTIRAEYERRALQREVPSWLAELRTFVASDSVPGLSVRQLARAAGVSREHLSRSYMRYYQTPLKVALQHRRIGRAFRAITSTRRGLAQIAFECDFADQSHMTRAFTDNYGITPASLRAGRREIEMS
jgi:AraC family transcriptional regulator